MTRHYSYGRQSIDETDIQAVVEALRSGWLTQGPGVSRFEEALSRRFGVEHAVAVANGTAGLHLIGLACGWSSEDIVITTPLTFLASANCALYCGSRVDFADIDPDTYTLCPGRLEEKLKRYRQQGRNVKAVVAVDYAGHPCEWEELQALAKRYEFQLIDDACHALGARYKGVEVCSSRFADAVSLSFHPVKTITTGEGGAVLTNDPRLAERIRRLRTHGMTKDPARLEKNDGPWYYEMHELGFNYRISDIQCALGSSQLARLDRFNQRRREIAAYYRARLDQDLAVTPTVRPYVEHAYHLYPLRLRLERLREDRGHVFNELKARGLHLQVHYIPVHLQPLYRRRFGFQPGDFPLAEAFYQQEISLPIYPDLEDEDLEYIVGTINGILRSLAR